MTTIAQKLLNLYDIKTAIKNAIESKGVIVGSLALNQYAGKISEIPVATTGYVRPFNWLPLPEITASDEKFAGLVQINQTGRNFLSIYVGTGSFVVDWGDGTIENYGGSNTVNHEYDFANPLLTDLELDKKQAVVVITSTNLTSISLNQKHPLCLTTTYDAGWLDIAMAGALASILIASSTTTAATQNVSLKKLEKINVIKTANSISSIGYMCNGLINLKKIDFPAGTTILSANYAFNNCSRLLEIPPLKLSSCTQANYMFFGCSAVTEIPPSVVNLLACIQANYMFANLYSLKAIPEGFNLPVATYSNSMFQQNFLIKKLPVSLKRLGNSALSMFNGCLSLNEMYPINVSNCDNLSNIFSECQNLTEYKIYGAIYVYSLGVCFLEKSALELAFESMVKTSSNADVLDLSGAQGAKNNPEITKSITATLGSKLITLADTSSLSIGMTMVGGTLAASIAVSFTASSSTITKINHQLPNGTRVSFPTRVTTTGFLTYRRYYVVNATTDAFQISATPNGTPITFTNNGTGTMRHECKIVEIVTNTSIAVSTPMDFTGTQNMKFRNLDITHLWLMNTTTTG